MHTRLIILTYVISIGLLSISCEDKPGCDIGALNCECTVGGTCDAPYICGTNNVCIQDAPESNEYDPGSDPPPCGDGWKDEKTGLYWQPRIENKLLTYNSAEELCTGFGGNWRIPTIDELRTIVNAKLCPAIAAEAEDCPITHESNTSAWNEAGCLATQNECEQTVIDEQAKDPTKPFCLWSDVKLTGSCQNYFWSSSKAPDLEHQWIISFAEGSILNTNDSLEIPKEFRVRCVCTETAADTDSASNTDSDSGTEPN